MAWKSRERLEKEIIAYRVAAAFLVLIILFIGGNNMSTTQAADSYKCKYEEQKAKAKVLDDELRDIKESGTCLMRIPALEA